MSPSIEELREAIARNQRRQEKETLRVAELERSLPGLLKAGALGDTLAVDSYEQTLEEIILLERGAGYRQEAGKLLEKDLRAALEKESARQGEIDQQEAAEELPGLFRQFVSAAKPLTSAEESLLFATARRTGNHYKYREEIERLRAALVQHDHVCRMSPSMAGTFIFTSKGLTP